MAAPGCACVSLQKHFGLHRRSAVVSQAFLGLAAPARGCTPASFFACTCLYPSGTLCWSATHAVWSPTHCLLACWRRSGLAKLVSLVGRTCACALPLPAEGVLPAPSDCDASHRTRLVGCVGLRFAATAGNCEGSWSVNGGACERVFAGGFTSRSRARLMRVPPGRRHLRAEPGQGHQHQLPPGAAPEAVNTAGRVLTDRCGCRADWVWRGRVRTSCCTLRSP